MHIFGWTAPLFFSSPSRERSSKHSVTSAGSSDNSVAVLFYCIHFFKQDGEESQEIFGTASMRSNCQTTMITRRRGRAMNNTEVQPLEVEELDVVETVKDIKSPSEGIQADNSDTTGIQLDDLFGIEDFKWTLERDAVSSLFNIELDDLGVSQDQDSEIEASTSSSPERMSDDLKIKNRQNLSSHMINKNAIAARLNRLRKKEYVNSLEKKVGILSTENNVLKQGNSQLTKRVEELEDETRYLRAVLANESMLAQLLSRLSGVSGMKLSSSLFQGPESNDHDYALPRKRVKVEEKETAGGVCLHVDKNHVSVEFCTKCAESASTSLKM
ncbi:uncharacterized protein crebzf [Cottoperca gobio]|uniref:Uncharacterized protein crebzf n=1 Tax=Cottoperca gobio TaxID=56716 RepID=A0A6J2Q300_COTGO|nr:CREB/ATF bZIP transcription factor [Cottoperca gobio]